MADINITLNVDSAGAVQGVQRARVAIEDFDRSMTHADGVIRQFERSVGSFRKAVLSVGNILGGFGLAMLVKHLIDVNVEFERVRVSLLVGANSAAAAAANFAWIRQEAIRLGVPLSQVGLEFTKLAAAAKNTALQGEPTRKLFSSVTQAAVATGRDAATTSRIFMALTQMLSKGKVQAEEVRQQFGEHLPGGFRLFAEAAGFAQNQLGKFSDALKKGTVDAVQALTKLPEILDREFGPAFQAALETSPAKAIGSFKAMIEDMTYTVGQSGGFMREFVGLLRDMQLYLAQPEGVKQMNRLATALGLIMGLVRQLANVVVKNIADISAAFSGLTVVTAVLAVRAFVQWMFKAAGTATLIGALTNPWLMLGVAIGTAVALLSRFSDTVVTMGGQTARVIDWVSTGFEMLKKIAQDALKSVTNFVMSIPGVQQVTSALKEAYLVFNQMRKISGNSLGDALGAAGSSLANSARNAVGETNWLKIQDAIRVTKSVALDFANTVSSVFNGLASALIATFKSVWANIRSGFDTLKSIVIPLGQSIKQVLLSLGGSNTFEALINAARTAGTILVNVWLASINAIGVAFNLMASLAKVAFDAIAPAVEPAIRAIGGVIEFVADKINKILDPKMEMSAWERAKVAIRAVYSVIAEVVGQIMAFVSLVSSIVGPIIDAFTMAARGIYNAFVGVFQTISAMVRLSTGQMSTDMQKSAQSSGNGWLKAGNIIIGVILTVIQTLGLFIEAIGVVIRTVGQLADRTATIFNSLGAGLTGMIDRDGAAVKKAGQDLADAVTTPLDTGFKQLIADGRRTLGGVADNFTVLDKAATAYSRSSNAVQIAGDQTIAGLERFNGAIVNNAVTQESAAVSGENVAKSYFDGLMTQWATGSAEAMKVAKDAADRAAAAREAQARANEEAWQKENAGVDRTMRQETADPKAKRGKSTTDRAADQIADLQAQIRTESALTSELNKQSISYKDSNAVQAAQSALRRAGYEITYRQAQAEGGLAAKLADTAFQAAITHERLENLQKAQEDIAKNEQQSSALRDQIRLARDLNMTNVDFEAQQAANNALRSRGIDLTYQQVMATTDEANATARRLATTEYQVKVDEASAKATRNVTSALQALAQTRSDTLLLSSVSNDARGTDEAMAAIAGQQAVMSAYGDAMFDATRLTDDHARALYNEAKAFSLAGGSASSYANAVTSLNDSYNQTFVRGRELRSTIQDQANAQAEQLRAGHELTLRAIQDNALLTESAKAAARAKEEQSYAEAGFQLAQLTTRAILEAPSRDPMDGLMQSMHAAYEDATNISKGIADTFSNAFSQMTDALTQFVMTGKLNFKSFANAVIQDITRMIVKLLIMKAIEATMNFILPGSGTAFAAASSAFANGGIMTNQGSVPLNTYAKGGVATSPQMALFGEGSKPEAYVPLPDGRTIPVTLSGGTANAQSGIGIDAPVMMAAITQMTTAVNGFSRALQYQQATSGVAQVSSALATPTVDVPTRQGYYNTSSRGSDTLSKSVTINTSVTIAGGSSAAGQSTDQQNKFADMMSKRISAQVKQDVIDTMMSESRPGGTFNKMGSEKARF